MQRKPFEERSEPRDAQTVKTRLYSAECRDNNRDQRAAPRMEEQEELRGKECALR